MFENTIFNNTKVVKQNETFEYAHILIPLNAKPELTMLVWERLFKLMGEGEDDESSLWNSDME